MTLTFTEAQKYVGATIGRFRRYLERMHIAPADGKYTERYPTSRPVLLYAVSDIKRVRDWHMAHGKDLQ